MQKLSDFYPWNDECDVSEQFIVCYDNSSGSGEFPMIYSLLKFIKNEVNVEIVCSNHDRIHYESILRKNVSLQMSCKYHRANHFNFVEYRSQPIGKFRES